MANSLGEAIAEALANAMDEMPHKGPELPLNEAAKLIHEAHCAFVDSTVPLLQEAELAATKIRNRLTEERDEWALAMKKVQPELGKGMGFEINEKTHMYRIAYKNEEELAEATGKTTDVDTPDWSKGLRISGKPN